MASSSIFWRCFISLVKFWDCSNFQVNIITDFGVMTIFFHKGLTRNPEIGNTAFWVLSKTLSQGRVRDTKFDTDVWCYWMLQNARDTASTISALLRENQQEEWVKLPPPPSHTQIRVKIPMDCFFQQYVRGSRRDRNSFYPPLLDLVMSNNVIMMIYLMKFPFVTRDYSTVEV